MLYRLLKLFLQKKFFIVFFVIIYFSIPFITNAATLSLSPNSSSVNVGNIVSIKVSVNTQGVYINNGEASIQFPADLLEVISISKSSSIFSLWVEEPSFSNSNGKITFNGGVANPGFNGSNGFIASITFKAKKIGIASLIFSDAAVRENDGLGTNVLTSKSSASVQIGTAIPAVVPDVPPVPVNPNNIIPTKPIIISETHPDQNFWYPLDTASFKWKIPAGVTSLQATLNKTSNGIPNTTYDSSVTEKTISSISDGVSYFHLRYRNTNGWSTVSHYQINIDKTVPLAFTPTIRNLENDNFIKLDAVDATSGISYYTLKIDDNNTIKVKKSDLVKEEYLLPVLNVGTHEITISAYDKAGNHTEAKTSFTSSNISIPEISISSKEITKGESIIISGKTDYSNSKVGVTLELDGKTLKEYQEITLPDGTFSFATDKIKSVGTINIWAENIFGDNIKSKPSEKLFLKVNEPEIVKVTLAVFWLILLLILVMILMFIAYEGWHKFLGLKKETDKAREEAHRALLLFKDELNEQLEVLEKTKLDRNLNKKEEAIFAELQKNVDHMDDFIEKKFKKFM